MDNSDESLTVTITSLPDSLIGSLQTTTGQPIAVDDVISYPWNIVFVASANQYGNSSFTFVAFDGELYSEPATVFIVVGFVNDIPVAYTDSLVTARYRIKY